MQSPADTNANKPDADTNANKPDADTKANKPDADTNVGLSQIAIQTSGIMETASAPAPTDAYPDGDARGSDMTDIRRS
jgi:hypothetical protein